MEKTTVFWQLFVGKTISSQKYFKIYGRCDSDFWLNLPNRIDVFRRLFTPEHKATQESFIARFISGSSIKSKQLIWVTDFRDYKIQYLSSIPLAEISSTSGISKPSCSEYFLRIYFQGIILSFWLKSQCNK